MRLDDLISDGIKDKKERPRGRTSSITFYLDNKIITYTVDGRREERYRETGAPEQYASNYFG